ncbi:MAG: glycosyltransferase family 2 protein [Prolixibacteraceae bacterium]
MNNHRNIITTDKSKPKISVITVVFNGQKYIESTIISVINQNYSELEYIIIDGGSSDGTTDIIKKYALRISYWISERDNGIYDAMNKGIDNASGEWVIFMNCGDFFYNNNVLSQVFNTPIPNEIVLIYGGAFVRSEWGDFYLKARHENQLWKSFTHQSMFSRIEINKKYKFNLEFKAASDYDFVYTVFSRKHKTLSLNIIISDILFVSTGFSSINEVNSKKDVLKSILIHRMEISDFVKHYSFHWIAYIRKRISLLIKYLSPDLIHFIRIIRDKNKHI